MADSKTTALTELTTFSGDETFYVVEDDDGTPVSRRVTVENLAAGLAARTEFSGTYAPLASPALTGNPTAPTPTAGDNDTSIATTAFVTTAVAAGGGGISQFEAVLAAQVFG